MKPIKIVAVIAVLASILSVAMYLTINSRMDSVAAVRTVDSDAEATEYDRQLSERLIRFGQVAFDRGQIAEAKHFFQQAITADPTYAVAWKKYNTALLNMIVSKVAEDPAYLSGFSVDSTGPNTGAADTPSGKSVDTSDDDDGC